MRFVGPIGILAGMVAVIAGGLLQMYGAAAIVFCSVIGAGIVLIVAAGAIWLFRALRPRTPPPVAA
jgi:hypothetical protein